MKTGQMCARILMHSFTSKFFANIQTWKWTNETG